MYLIIVLLLRSIRVSFITQYEPLYLYIFLRPLFPVLVGDPGREAFGVAKADPGRDTFGVGKADTFSELTRELSSLGNFDPFTESIPNKDMRAGFMALPPEATASKSAGSCKAIPTLSFCTKGATAAPTLAVDDDDAVAAGRSPGSSGLSAAMDFKMSVPSYYINIGVQIRD